MQNISRQGAKFRSSTGWIRFFFAPLRASILRIFLMTHTSHLNLDCVTLQKQHELFTAGDHQGVIAGTSIFATFDIFNPKLPWRTRPESLTPDARSLSIVYSTADLKPTSLPSLPSSTDPTVRRPPSAVACCRPTAPPASLAGLTRERLQGPACLPSSTSSTSLPPRIFVSRMALLPVSPRPTASEYPLRPDHPQISQMTQMLKS